MPKLSSYDDAGTLDGTETVPLVVDGVNKKTTAQAIADLGGSGGGTPGVALATKVSSNGDIIGDAFNVASVNKTDVGIYDVAYTADINGTRIGLITCSDSVLDPPNFGTFGGSSSPGQTSAIVRTVDMDGNPVDCTFSLVIFEVLP